MATFNVTSRSTTQPGDHAFNLDSAVADTLNVGANVSLTTTGAGSRGALLAPTGAWTVNVDGRVFSENSIGIDLAAGNTAFSTINIRGTVGGEEAAIAVRSPAEIANSGKVVGTVSGIAIQNGGKHAVANSGLIRGDSFSIVDVNGLSDDKVANSGTLDGAVSLGGGTNELMNSGTIEGAVSGGNGTDAFSNAGTIFGDVSLGGGTNTLTNQNRFALIEGDVAGGSGNDTINNFAGTITGTVFLGDGTNRLTNSGTIRGEEGSFNPNLDSVIGGSGNDTVINSGTILEGVNLGGGQNTVGNSGTIDGGVSFASFGGGGSDTVTNSGQINEGVNLGSGDDTLNNSGTITGAVLGGDGIDTVTNTGTILDVINLGNGNDTFNGGNTVETVRDFNGADTVNLGGGGDTYIATYNNSANTGTDGIDAIDGGEGYDTYDASGATSRVLINLGSIPGEVMPNTATGVDVAGTLRDTITGFENAKAGSANDTLFGTNERNTLEGGGGNDFLFGLGDNDTLNGGTGNDVIVGGLGRDTLTGDGLAPGTVSFDDIADHFRFFSASESGTTNATRDVITDFQFWQDKIDLQFDANTNTAANNQFTWIGTDAFSGTAGELRERSVTGGKIVEADLNGDAAADFSIELRSTSGAITLSADIFGL